MGFEIINKLKKEKGLTNAQVAQMAGITLSTLDKITSGINTNPKLGTLQAICSVLGCTLNDFSDTPITERLSTDERTHIKKYRLLDPYGKEAVDGVLDVEYRRCRQNQAARDAALFRGGREETEAAEIFPELKMPTLVSKSGLEAEKKQLMEALDKFSPVQLQMYFDQMRKLSGLQIEASPSFVPPEDAQKVLGPDSSAPPL